MTKVDDVTSGNFADKKSSIYYKESDARYKEVVLTDGNGKTGYMVGTQVHKNVTIPATQFGYRHGGVKVVATGGGNLAERLQALYAKGAGEAGETNYTKLSLTLTAQGKVRVASTTDAVYTANTGDNPAPSTVTFTLDLEADGSRQVWGESATSPDAFMDFYFSVAGSEDALDTESGHTNDGIEASIDNFVNS